MFGKMKVAMLAAVFVALVHPAAAGQQESSRDERLRRMVEQAEQQGRSRSDVVREFLLTGGSCTASYEDGYGCFDLWNGCKNVKPSVIVAPNALGLRLDDVKNAVQSRLRAAGFDPDDALGTILVLEVQLLRGAYNIVLLYGKGSYFEDDYGFSASIPTYQTHRFGVHGGQASYVMERVRGMLDEFMNHYLRVNGPACSRR